MVAWVTSFKTMLHYARVSPNSQRKRKVKRASGAVVLKGSGNHRLRGSLKKVIPVLVICPADG